MIVGRLNRKRSVSMKSKRILMLAQPPAEQAYWTECILNGARQRASRFEAVIVLYESAEELLKQEKQADRALVIGYSQRWFEDVTRQLLSQNVEPIFVSAYTPMDERYNAVCFSISSCVEEMIHYLRSAGRRRIAFFGYNPDSPADASKAKVFLRTCRQLHMDDCEAIPAGYEKAFREHVDLLMEELDRFDAFICANDPIAVHLIPRLISEGYKVPEDYFILSFGDLKTTREFNISITSVSFDYTELGRQAVALFLDTESNSRHIHHRITLPCELVVRRSTNYYYPSEALRSEPEWDKTPTTMYYSDPDLSYINQTEGLLQCCDEWDVEIIFALMRGDTYQQMAQTLNFSERSIKNRVQKLRERVDKVNRKELCEFFRPLLDHIYREDA